MFFRRSTSVRSSGDPITRAANYTVEQLEQRTMLSVTVTGIPNWTEQGPGPIQGGQVTGITDRPVTGAVHAIAVHPTDASTIWIGTTGGGIWKTTNGGTSWLPKTDQFPSLSISAISVDPVNPNIVWAGTGRISSSSLDTGRFIGLLKSSDGGETWRIVPSIFATQKRSIHVVAPTKVAQGTGRVLMVGSDATPTSANPAQPTHLNGGLIRSTDGGIAPKFKKISGNINDGLDNDGDKQIDEADEDTGLPGGTVTDIEGDPSNPSRFYCAIAGHGVFVSEDAGATWTPTTTAGTDALTGTAQTIRGKIELSVSGGTVNGTHPVYAGMVEMVEEFLSAAPARGDTTIQVPAGALFRIGDTITIFDQSTPRAFFNRS